MDGANHSRCADNKQTFKNIAPQHGTQADLIVSAELGNDCRRHLWQEIADMQSAAARIIATFKTLLPSASPSEISGRPDSAAPTATESSGLEVAKAATVAAMIPAETPRPTREPHQPAHEQFATHSRPRDSDEKCQVRTHAG